MHCTNHQGSALYDATLGDDELIEQMFADAKAQQSSKRRVPTSEAEEDPRPARRGYSREVEAIYDLTDNIVAMRAEAGRWAPSQTARAFTRRPWFPAEVVEQRMRRRATKHVNKAVEAAQARWRAEHDDSGRGT